MSSDARSADPARTRLHIEADTNRLAEVRAFVRDCVARAGGTKRAQEDLVQAVDEATCNVILHGYRGKEGEIDIETELRGRDLEIRILDRAPVFDPTKVPDTVDAGVVPTPSGPGTMGVGLHLARTMTDSVRHHVRPDGGNELTLVRSIDDRAEED